MIVDIQEGSSFLVKLLILVFSILQTFLILIVFSFFVNVVLRSVRYLTYRRPCGQLNISHPISNFPQDLAPEVVPYIHINGSYW